MTTRDERAAQYNSRAVSKHMLVQTYRQGFRTDDGRWVQYMASAHPPETWRKDEIIASLLNAEFGFAS